MARGIFTRFLLKQPKRVLRAVLSGLLEEEKRVSVKADSRVAVGFGTCIDCVVPGLTLLQSLGIEPPRRSQHHELIQTTDHFRETFSHFFKHGAAAERYIPNKNLFRALVDGADELPGTRWSMGGNASTMAQRFALDGCEVLLGACMTAAAHNFLHPKIKIAGNDLLEDDVHLMLEYSSGSQYGAFSSPRFNRFIVHSDTSNAYLESMEIFVKDLDAFSPDLLIIGGLQLMDGFPFHQGERTARLKRLRDVLVALPSSVRIHFEMASFSEKELMDDLLRYVIPHVDSLGMNEQELPNLFSELKFGNVSLVSDAIPTVGSVLDIMREVYQTLSQPSRLSGRSLSRLHIHTLGFQAIMCRKDSAWCNTSSAAAKASLSASRWISGSEELDMRRTYLLLKDAFAISNEPGSERMPFEPDAPVSCWDEGDYEMCVAPMLVCNDVVQTGGAGDNISAAGMVLQI